MRSVLTILPVALLLAACSGEVPEEHTYIEWPEVSVYFTGFESQSIKGQDTLDAPFSGDLSYAFQCYGLSCEDLSWAVSVQHVSGEGGPAILVDSLVYPMTESSNTVWQSWSSASHPLTSRAGADPSLDDRYTLKVTAAWEGEESLQTDTDVLTIPIDNTRPVAELSAVCRDAEGKDCFPLVDGSTPVEVSLEDTPALYFFGLAEDKHFVAYDVLLVGGTSSQEQFLCRAPENNSGCVTVNAAKAQPYGYGRARDENGVETLDPDGYSRAESEPLLLFVWPLDNIEPDAYAIHLQVQAEVADPLSTVQFANSWMTLNLH